MRNPLCRFAAAILVLSMLSVRAGESPTPADIDTLERRADPYRESAQRIIDQLNGTHRQDAAARQALRHSQSPVFEARVNDAKTTIEGLVKDDAAWAFGQAQAADTHAPSDPNIVEDPPTDRVYVFISTSVPLTTLRHYAADLAGHTGATLVLRGFVEGATTLKPTMKFIASILREDASCDGPQCAMRPLNVIIDPLLFRRFDIQRAPSVVYAQDAARLGSCSEGLDDNLSIGAWGKIAGDAPVEVALEQLGMEPSLNGANAWVARLRGEGG